MGHPGCRRAHVAWIAQKLRMAVHGAWVCHSTKQREEYPFELLTKDAIDDKVDRTVDSYEEITGLSQRMIHLAKVLKEFSTFYRSIFS